MFWHKTSMRKPLFSKAKCSSTKKEFIRIIFPSKFQKMSRKKKTFRKIINRGCFNQYFCRYVLEGDKIYLQNSFKKIFSRCSEQMYNVESLGRYFSFCPCLIRQIHSCLISFHLFDKTWWKLKGGFFPERLTQPIAAQHGIMKITMNSVTE